MSSQEFEDLVEQAIATIPARFRKLLKNVVFLIEPEAPDRDLLGLHEFNPPHPDRIIIYERPHLEQSRTPEELFRLVQETVFHEVGHYLGMDEAEVARMELNRRVRQQRRRSGSILPGR